MAETKTCPKPTRCIPLLAKSRIQEFPRERLRPPVTSPNVPGNPLHIDIAGEGRYPNAINLNSGTLTSTTGVAGRPIPNLIQGVGEHLPFANGSVAGISLENTRITPQIASEIARTIQPGGSIRLFSPADYASIAHQRVISAVGGTFSQSTKGGMTTTVINAPR